MRKGLRIAIIATMACLLALANIVTPSADGIAEGMMGLGTNGVANAGGILVGQIIGEKGARALDKNEGVNNFCVLLRNSGIIIGGIYVLYTAFNVRHDEIN